MWCLLPLSPCDATRRRAQQPRSGGERSHRRRQPPFAAGSQPRASADRRAAVADAPSVWPSANTEAKSQPGGLMGRASLGSSVAAAVPAPGLPAANSRRWERELSITAPFDTRHWAAVRPQHPSTPVPSCVSGPLAGLHHRPQIGSCLPFFHCAKPARRAGCPRQCGQSRKLSLNCLQPAP